MHQAASPPRRRALLDAPRLRGAVGRISAAPLWALAVFACAMVLALLMIPSILPRSVDPPKVVAGDIGVTDSSFAANGVKAPTGRKPEAAKLWFNDGLWWGSLFDRSRDAYLIHRFDWSSGKWIDTGTMIDDRNFSRADVLWDGRYLYAVSGGNDPTSTKHVALLLRFSYDHGARQYSLDQGFPIKLTSGGAETFVIDEDALGQVWVTFTHNRTVYVTHSLATDRAWTVPFALPMPEASNLTPDDISAVVGYDGHLGVMWSDQTDGAMYFASHPNGTDDSTWSLTTPIQGPGLADDHMSLKALSRDPAGLVFAAIKTSLNDAPNVDPVSPLVELLVLRADGSWEHHLFGTVSDQQTRPLLLIDREHRRLYMFVSAPCCSGGTIYYKSTSLDDISFPDGLGTPFIRSAKSGAVNNPASTRQNLDSASNLLVIASDDKNDAYMHNVLTLDGPPVAPPSPLPGVMDGPLPSAAPGAATSGSTGLHTVWLDDGFESGNWKSWSSVRVGADGTARVESGGARSDRYAAHLSTTTADGSFADARFSLPSGQADLSLSIDVKVLREGPLDGNVPLVRLFDGKGKRLVSIYRQNHPSGRIWVGDDKTHAPTDGKLSLLTWARLDVDVLAGSTGATVRARLDGALIYEAIAPSITGPAVRSIQIGNEVGAQPFDLLVDNVRIQR